MLERQKESYRNPPAGAMQIGDFSHLDDLLDQALAHARLFVEAEAAAAGPIRPRQRPASRELDVVAAMEAMS